MTIIKILAAWGAVSAAFVIWICATCGIEDGEDGDGGYMDTGNDGGNQ